MFYQNRLSTWKVQLVDVLSQGQRMGASEGLILFLLQLAVSNLGPYLDLKLSICFLKVSQHLTPAEKTELDNRATLPHTADEVSDLWVHVKAGLRVFRVNFMVKSAREHDTSIPIAVWQQWTRPIEKDYDISVLISYTRPSVNLENRKEQYNTKGNCFRAICGRALATLFLKYNQLT